MANSEWRIANRKSGIHVWARHAVPLALLLVFGLASQVHGQQLRKIHVAIPAISPASTTFVVAREMGYYRDEGLHVELVAMPAAVAIQALIGRNTEFATVGGAGLPPVLRGAPLRFLFTTFNRPMFWLYAKPEIRSIRDLKGKKVGVSSLGSGPDSLLRDLLKKHGLEGGRDVVIMPMGAGTARFVALKAGSVDAAMLSIPSNFMADEAGYRELVALIKQDLVELQGSILAREEVLESDPVLVEKFVRGSLKGLLYFQKKRSGTAAILTRFLRTKEDVAARIYDLVHPGITQDGTVSEDLQRRSMEHILDRVGLKEPPSIGKVFDFALTKKVRDDLQQKGWMP
ncbi:MAG: ABC transporter substrate-binding protein [Deltaproteobacteria bacterium]|nr:ABC transporter substrate-binding protein [Deltaproteobacteria bacterium]